jgi:sec-independent protein translocase protein TatC
MNLLRMLVGSRPTTPGAEMSFFDHLEELRSVLLASLAAVFLFGLAGWSFSARVMDSLVRHAGLASAQAIKPQEIFLTRFKISVAIGVLVGMPYIALRVWNFIVPGLLQRERRVLFPLVFWSTLLFLLGTAFAVFMLVPMMLGFLASFATDVVNVNPAVSQVLDFYIFSGLACGLVFQLPLLVAILTYFGIISPRLLVHYWRHAVVVILILAAILTPSDVISQLAMGIPIIVLYFASIIVSFAARRARRGNEPEREEPRTAPAVVAPAGGPPVGGAPGPGGGEGAGHGAQEPPPEGRPDAGAQASAGSPTVDDGPGAEASEPPDESEARSQPRPLHPSDQDWSI